MKKIVLLLLPFIVLFYLGLNLLTPSLQTEYQFYHWTQGYSIEENESNPPRYVKVLDISYSKGLKLFKTSFKTDPKNITPVIYIDNPLFLDIRAKTLLNSVLKSLKEMPLNSYKEIQVDCDWTGKTKKRYFEFLTLLKEQSKKKISTTIRLHQIKYHKKTGVPPVDYGVLMYYNMSDFKDLETKNYILDLEVSKRYHYNFDTYPLALNLALPLYSQATIIRFSKVVGIMEGVRTKDINSNFKKIKENLYLVTKTHYFKKRLLYEEDKIRIDEVSVVDLKESIIALKKVMKQPKEIIFYRWGNRAFYGDDKLKNLLQLWN
jgi:hypothetical protein